jgi:hypothetical protein
MSELPPLEGVADEVGDAPEEAHDLAMVHASVNIALRVRVSILEEPVRRMDV